MHSEVAESQIFGLTLNKERGTLFTNNVSVPKCITVELRKIVTLCFLVLLIFLKKKIVFPAQLKKSNFSVKSYEWTITIAFICKMKCSLFVYLFIVMVFTEKIICNVHGDRNVWGGLFLFCIFKIFVCVCVKSFCY